MPLRIRNIPPANSGNHLYIGRVHNVYRLLQIEFSFDKFHITTFDNIISLFAKAAKNYYLYSSLFSADKIFFYYCF